MNFTVFGRETGGQLLWRQLTDGGNFCDQSQRCSFLKHVLISLKVKMTYGEETDKDETAERILILRRPFGTQC